MRIQRTLPPAAAPIYLRDILSGIRGLFSGQRELNRFESELKDYFNVEHCFLFSSGKAALAFALLALKERHPERHEVVIPAYICYSVPSATVHAGLEVVPCDMNPDTLEIDLRKLSQLLRETTLCVIVPHLFGVPAQISEILKLCHEKDIIVIEDAAQTIGVAHHGKILGTQGDIGFFSLGRGKTLSTVEGGILVTNDGSLGRPLRTRLVQLGSYTATEKAILLIKAFLLALFTRPSLYWFPKSLPFLRLGETVYDPDFPLKKMCEIQAGLARNWKKKLEYFNAQRKENVQTFLMALSGESLSPFVLNNGRPPACLRLPFYIERIEDKERIVSESEKRGLGIMFTYPDSTDGIPELRNMVTPGEYPESRRMAQHILTLPVHPLVSEKDLHEIIDLFKQTISHRSPTNGEL